MNDELLYPTEITIKKLTKALNLTGAYEHTQDWEIEVADYKQLSEYIEYYKNTELSINEKTTLIRIIMVAYDDYFSIVGKDETVYWTKIKSILKRDYYLHKDTIRYWALWDEDVEDGFSITELVRELDKEIGGV